MSYVTLSSDCTTSNDLREIVLPGPTLTFGFILATLYGALFHFVLGGDVRRLALFLLAGWVGFLLGHILGVAFAIDFLNVGVLRIMSATGGAFATLLLTHFLTLEKLPRR